MKSIVHLLTVVAILFFTPVAQSAMPTVIPYHGRVAVSAAPFTGGGQFRFALTNEDGSQVHWKNSLTDQPVAVNVVAGEFEVAVGDASVPNMQDIPFAVFDNSPLYLRVWFDDDTNGEHELLPATRLLAVPFAIIAKSVEDGAITTGKIADGAVMPGKIGNEAVGSAQIFPGAVQSTHLGNEAVGSANLASAAVGTAHLVDAAVTTPKLADNAVTTAKIYPEAVDTAQLAPFAVGSGQIVNGAITDQKIANGAVTAPKIPDRSVAGVKLETGGVGTTELADASVTAVKLAPGAVGADALDPAGLQTALNGLGYSSAVPGALALSFDSESEDLLYAGYRRTGVLPGKLNWDSKFINPHAIPQPRSNGYVIPTKEGFELWGGWGSSLGSYMVNEVNSISVDGAEQISWSSSSPGAGAPPSRTRGCHLPIANSRYFTWGGFTIDGGLWIPLASGGTSQGFKYWQGVTAVNAPDPRGYHSAVWTGEQVLVYGGCNGSSPTNNAPLMGGNRFNNIYAWAPTSDTWTLLQSDVQHSVGRAGHHAVWTGSEMLVWGGRDQAEANLGNGFAYDPGTNISRPLSTSGAPEATIHQVVVWTGPRMVVASLYPATTTLTIHHYDPITDFWTLAYSDIAWSHDKLTGRWDGTHLILGSFRSLSGLSLSNFYAYQPDSTTLRDIGSGIYALDEFVIPDDFGWNGRHIIQTDRSTAAPYYGGVLVSASTPDLYIYSPIPPDE